MTVELPAHGIVYMPVPKAACTSVKAALLRIDPRQEVDEAGLRTNPDQVHQIYQTKRFRPHRWEPYCNGQWWRFAVVRDPVKRILSVYTDRVIGRNELKNSPKLRKQSRLPANPDPDFFFQHLQEYKELSSVVKHHALPQRLFVGPSPLKYDRVYKTEELHELANDLSERSGIEVVIPRFNTSSSTLLFSDLSRQTQLHLKEIVSEEYDHLADFYPNPFA